MKRQSGPELRSSPDGLPSNVEAERAILGSVLLDNDRWAEVSARLEEGDFSLFAHRELFRVIGRMRAAGTPVDLVTLLEEMMHMKSLAGSGGAAYCAELTTGLPRRIALDAYIRIVKEKARLRSLMIAASVTWDRCMEPGVIAIDLGREAVKSIKAIFREAHDANSRANQ
jgi:replicative DNA helicase